MVAVILLPLVNADLWDYLTKPRADTLYCSIEDGCGGVGGAGGNINGSGSIGEFCMWNGTSDIGGVPNIGWGNLTDIPSLGNDSNDIRVVIADYNITIEDINSNLSSFIREVNESNSLWFDDGNTIRPTNHENINVSNITAETKLEFSVNTTLCFKTKKNGDMVISQIC